MSRPATSGSSRSRIAFAGLGLASSFFFLWLVLRRADLGAVWVALRHSNLSELALATLVVELVYVAQALRWRILTGTSSLPRHRFLMLVLAGVATNNVLPLRAGDLFRARWLASAAPMPTGQALGSVVRDRLCDIVVLVGGLVVTLPLVGSARWVRSIAVAGVGLMVFAILVIVAAVIYARRHPRARRGSRSTPRRFVRDLFDELASPLGRRRIAVALLLSVAAWTAFALAARLVCGSLGIELAPVEVVFATCVINLGVAIPSSPGFVGTYQWLAVSALAVVGVDRGVALAFALLMQAIWFVPTTLVGGPIALREASRDAILHRAVG
jgi:uncharacterized protein (TIRG00374 family)